ncbi:MAG: MFS transporter, partial [Nocardioides sp.]|nr:MFS transporter [Nocardioides sp.]
WCVGQVARRQRLEAPTDLYAISRPYRIPAPVFEPAFAQSVEGGYLTRSDDSYAVTDAGRAELLKLVDSLRTWLVGELADWGPDDDQLREAVGALSRRMIDGDSHLPELAEPAAG